MQQVKALVRKEWQTHKNSFLVPLYVVSGILAVFALISLYGMIRFGSSSIITPGFSEIRKEYLDVLIWNLVVTVAGVIGIFCMASINHVNECMINHDHQKKCEILHNAQPCAPIKIVAAKWSFSYIGIMIQYLLITLILALIFSAISACMGHSFWVISLKAVLSTLPMLLYASFVINSGIWLFSCIFRRKSSLYTAIFVFGGHFLQILVNNTWPQVKMPSPLTFIFSTASQIFRYREVRDYGIFHNPQMPETWKLVLQLAVAGMLYFLGYLIYKKREIV